MITFYEAVDNIFTFFLIECYHCGVEFQSTEEMKNHPSRCDRMKNARNIGQVNLSDFNGEVHITQKDTFSKSRQKRKKNTPKTGQFLLKTATA